MRNLAGVALVVLAAAVVHWAGHHDQQWQYAVIAAALVPQIIVNVLALKDGKRRESLRVSGRPRVILLLPAAVLAVSAPVTWLTDGPAVPALAGLCAAAGLAIAASPATIVFGPRAA
jgi:hypothetical protein